MSAHEIDEDDLRAAGALADGNPLPADDSTGDPVQRNLRRLQSLRDAFGQYAGEPAVQGMVLQQWKHLKLVATIGHGGFGQVYRAFDPILQREVALKLRRADSTSIDDGHDWIREARRLARVRHPNVLAVHGADIDNAIVGLWADLIDGQTLEEHIQREGPIDPARLLDIAPPLFDALLAVHAAGIVHGDIKTSNVMIERSGRVVLMDFGAGSDIGSRQHARAGSLPAMAPELLQGEPPTPASDTFSLGVLLYRMLHAQWPDAHAGAGTPRNLKTRVPRALRQLIQLMYSPQATDRPSLTDARATLQRIATAPQRRRRMVALGTVIASLLLGTVVGGLGYLQASREAERANQARRDAEATTLFLRDVLAAPQSGKLGRNRPISEVVDAAVLRLDQEFPADTASGRILRAVLGKTQQNLDRLEDAERLLREALHSYEVHCTDCDAERIQTREALGSTVGELRRYDEAEVILAKAMDELQLLPTDHSLHAIVRVRRGEVALKAGDLDAAAAWTNQAWEIAPQLNWVKPTDRNILWVARMSLQLERGEYSIAEATAREFLAWLEQFPDAMHDARRNAHTGLGVALARQSKFSAAESQFRTALALAVEQLGATDSITITLHSSIGNALSGQGNDAQAALLHRQALELLRSSSDHVVEEEISVLLNLGSALLDAGAYDDAQPVVEETLAKARAAYGEHHPQTLLIRVNQAELALFQGHNSSAAALGTAVAGELSKIMGPSHPFTQVARAIATAATLKQDPAQAATTLAPIVEALAKAFGDADPNVANARAWLGEALLRSGDAVNARGYLRQALLSRQQRLGASDPRTMHLETLLRQAAQ